MPVSCEASPNDRLTVENAGLAGCIALRSYRWLRALSFVAGGGARPGPADYEDLVQAGLVGLLAAARAFDPSRGVPFGGFAALVIRRAVHEEAERKAAWFGRAFPWGEGEGGGDRGESREEHAEGEHREEAKREAGLAVARLLATLAPELAEAVRLCDLEGLTHAEAAAKLGCSRSTVQHRRRNALWTLRVMARRGEGVAS